MKKKDEIILEIADVNFPNKAYGYYEGEKVIVKNAVPGQKVQAQVFKKRGSGVEARLQEVIERSPMERETGMCSHYALCGGTYQTMRHEEELRLKERQVKRLLENAGICVQSWEGIVPAPSETGYRNKCEFSFGDEEKDGDLALGMRKRIYTGTADRKRLGMRGKGRTKDGDRAFDAANQKRNRRKRHDHNREKDKKGACSRRIPHGNSIFFHLLLRGVSSIGG